MEASKKWYRRLMGFICALAGIVLLRAVPVTAAGNDAGNFTITGVETGGKAMKLVRHEKESHIYIADLPLASPYKELVIHGTVTGGGTPAVAASDMLGHRFQAERAGSDVTITRAATEERMYGAYVCHIDVGEEQYTLVLDCGINSGPLYLLDATADQYDYLGEETWLRKGHSSEDSRLVRAGLPGSVKAVALECEKDCVKTEKYSVDAMSWIAGGENYVRINRGAAHRFNGTLSGGASSSSGRLPLKKGVNVVELYEVSGAPMASVSNNNPGPEGLALRNKDYKFSTYLLYWDGEPQAYPRGTDTTLGLVDAVQLGSTSIPMAQYLSEAGENGDYTVVLPETMPGDKILLGLQTADPWATVSILNKSALARGDQVGIYQAVKITDGLTEIKVRVTAADKRTRTDRTIHLVNRFSECGLTGMTPEKMQVYTYDGTEVQTVQEGKDIYLASPREESGAIRLAASEGASISVDGEPSDTVSLPDTVYLRTVTVTAADGLHKNQYYFLRRETDGTVPLVQPVSEEDREKAEAMAAPWREYIEGTDDWAADLVDYWGTFKAAAVNGDFTGKHVYDVAKHSFSQATDWAACILELVLVGENPYDYRGIDFVAGLQGCKSSNGLYGGYGNNIWTLQALKVLGEPIGEPLVEAVKRDCMNSWSIDLQGWAVAALRGVIPDEELIALSLHLKDTQEQYGGVWGNAFTNGCVISGIVNAGLNLDYFQYKGKGLLEVMEEEIRIAVNNKNKDIVIALGDIINGENVYHRYRMTQGRWENLLEVAGGLAAQHTEDTELSGALEAMRQADGYQGNGELYFALLQLVGKYQEKVSYGSQTVKFSRVVVGMGDALTPNTYGKDYVYEYYGQPLENGWARYSWIRNPRPAGGHFHRLADPGEDYSGIRSKDMKDHLEFGSDKGEEEYYFDKIYFVQVLHYYNGLGGENVPDTTVEAFGPVKVDVYAPKVQVNGEDGGGTDNAQYTLDHSGNGILQITASDTMSGIWRISCRTEDGKETVLYDAETDVEVDMETYGKREIQRELPVNQAGQLSFIVKDLAGYATEASVTVAEPYSGPAGGPEQKPGQDPAQTPDTSAPGNTTEPPAKAPEEPAQTKSIAKLGFKKISDQAYTGKAVRPTVTVKDGKTKLKAGRDYTLTYKNNKKAGRASVTVKGKGAYTGKKTLGFNIRYSLKKAKVAKIKNQVYKKGKAAKPAVKVTYQGKKLKKGRDYTVTYQKNKKAGRAAAVIKGKGNYMGTRKVTFKIVKK